MSDERRLIRGRGAVTNPPNRFERLYYERDPEADPNEVRVETHFYDDPTKAILARNDSPDVGFEYSVNPYRGCEHGCVYCFARPTHEYLGFSSGLDFETRIMVKRDAPRLLREALMKKSWEPQVIAISGVTDPYQPMERKLALTRGCLEVLRDLRNPVSIITKNALVARDGDLLEELASHSAASVNFSITTLDPDLARTMEPRTSTPALKLQAMQELASRGVPVGVMIAPVIPAINDHEIPAILKAARAAGADRAGYILVRLPHQLKSIFEAWLEEHYPDRKDRVLNRLREMRGGKLYDPTWEKRLEGEGLLAEQLASFFEIARRKAGYPEERSRLSTAAFRRPTSQASLF
jgi:DNA repair photolyase